MRKLAVCGLLVLAFSTAALADTQIGTDLFAGYTLNAAGGNFNGTLTFTNTSGQSDIVIAWALNLFAGNVNVDTVQLDAGSPSGWEIFGGTTPGNDGSPCNSSGNSGNICADGFDDNLNPTSFTPGVIPANGTLTFFFSGTYSVPHGSFNLGDGHLQANGCLNADANSGWTYSDGTVDCTGDATKWAYSSPIGTHTTPEPATLTLLGAGLLGLAGLIRRKK